MVMDPKHFDAAATHRVPWWRSSRCTQPRLEVETHWLVEAAAWRQKGSTRRSRSTSTWPARQQESWIDTYKLAGARGLKTTYYLRIATVTHAEKSTVFRRMECGVLR
jgi:ribonucleoside-diphosphate reductase alpha chain